MTETRAQRLLREAGMDPLTPEEIEQGITPLEKLKFASKDHPVYQSGIVFMSSKRVGQSRHNVAGKEEKP